MDTDVELIISTQTTPKTPSKSFDFSFQPSLTKSLYKRGKRLRVEDEETVENSLKDSRHNQETEPTALLKQALILVQKANEINSEYIDIIQNLETAIAGRKNDKSKSLLEKKIDRILATLETPIRKEPIKKSYAQVVGNQQTTTPESRVYTTHIQKPETTQIEKSKKKPKNQLVLVTTITDSTTLNVKTLRDQLNERLSKKGFKSPVVAKITISFKKNIVITTLEPYTIKELEPHKETILEVFSLYEIQRIEAPETWFKAIIHGIPKEGFSDFKSEIETYNSVKIMGKPRWLVPIKDGKNAGSIVFNIKTIEEQNYCIKNGLTFYGSQFNVTKFKSFSEKTQCYKCQGFGHNPKNCNKKPVCRYCGKNHYTKTHVCRECKKDGLCDHTQLKCVNCEGNHAADSINCEIVKAIKGSISKNTTQTKKASNRDVEMVTI